MYRAATLHSGGVLFHVLNRGVGRKELFRSDKDFDAFRRVGDETLRLAARREGLGARLQRRGLRAIHPP